jgi:hypothetical protein
VSGEHRGDLMRVPATGRPFVLEGITIMRFDGDQVAERWTTADFPGLMGQLGAIPAPVRARPCRRRSAASLIGRGRGRASPGGGCRRPAARRGYRRPVLRWLFAAVVAGILTVFAFLLVTGKYTNDGPVLFLLTPEHGVHRGDVFVVCGWAAALLSEVGLLVSTRRR